MFQNRIEYRPNVLFIGELASFCTDEHVRCIFQSEGINVLDLKIIRGKQSAISLNYGFVQVPSLEDGIRAIKSLDSRVFYGRQIKLNWSKPHSKTSTKNYCRANSVHIRFHSLTPYARVTEEVLHEVFSNFGEVTEVWFKMDMNISGANDSGYGFIHFEGEDGMNSAFQAIQSISKARIVNQVEYCCEPSKNLLKQLQLMEHEQTMKMKSQSFDNFQRKYTQSFDESHSYRMSNHTNTSHDSEEFRQFGRPNNQNQNHVMGGGGYYYNERKESPSPFQSESFSSQDSEDMRHLMQPRLNNGRFLMHPSLSSSHLPSSHVSSPHSVATTQFTFDTLEHQHHHQHQNQNQHPGLQHSLSLDSEELLLHSHNHRMQHRAPLLFNQGPIQSIQGQGLQVGGGNQNHSYAEDSLRRRYTDGHIALFPERKQLNVPSPLIPTFVLQFASFSERHSLHAGCSFVIVNEESGSVVAEDAFSVTQLYAGSMQPDYEALHRGLLCALQHGLHKCRVKALGCSELLHLQLNTGSSLCLSQTASHAVDAIFNKVKRLLLEFPAIEFSLASRQSNGRVLEMAKSLLKFNPLESQMSSESFDSFKTDLSLRSLNVFTSF